jgi:hypothetical protein
MLPPTRDVGDFVVLYREFLADPLVVVLPNKDSYESELEEARTYLKLLGVPDELGAIDYVWNFRGGLVNLQTMQLEPLSLEQAMEYGRQE